MTLPFHNSGTTEYIHPLENTVSAIWFEYDGSYDQNTKYTIEFYWDKIIYTSSSGTVTFSNHKIEIEL